MAAIGTCEHGHYHVMEDYGCVEFEPNGDGTANLIATGFGNRSMPLPCATAPTTGWCWPIRLSPALRAALPRGRAVLGRVDDAIRTPDGRHVVMLDWIFSGLAGLVEAQVVQERLDEGDPRGCRAGLRSRQRAGAADAPVSGWGQRSSFESSGCPDRAHAQWKVPADRQPVEWK